MRKWAGSSLHSLMMYAIVIITPILVIGAAGAWIEWYDQHNLPYHHETCVETSRGAVVCGEVVR